MKNLKGLVTCLLVGALAACSGGGVNGWVKRNGSIGEKPGLLFMNTNVPTAEQPVTGDIDLIKTEDKNVYVIVYIELHLFGDFKMDEQTGAVSLTSPSFNYSSVDVKGYISSPTTSYVRCDIQDTTKDFMSNPRNLESINWQVDIRYDFTIAFTYWDNNVQQQNFSFTLELSKF